MNTFGEYPVSFVKNDGEVYITCKGVTGTLTQLENHLINHKKYKRFGESKITYKDSKVHIDCLSDTEEKFNNLINYGREVRSSNEIKSLANHLIDLPRKEREQVMQLVQQGDEDICFNETIIGYEDEILYALHQVIKDTYGEVLSQSTKGASGNIKPEYKNVYLPDGSSYTVIYGQIPLPGLDGESYIETNYNHKGFQMELECNIKNKDSEFIKEFVDKIRVEVRNNSFCKNKLLTVSYLREDGIGSKPTITDVSSLTDIDLLITDTTKFALDPFISRMENPNICKEMDVNPKYSLLLAGPGGTGKTAIMFNYITPIALKCGYTVIYSKYAKDFPAMLTLAESLTVRGWKPLLIVEDIDQAFDGETRGNLQQEILNTLDSGHNKTTPIMSIMTTNYIENISSYMLRAGRISKVVALGGVTKDDAKLFLDKYLEELLDPKMSYDKCYEALKGIVPSFIREIINESKIVARSNKLRYVTPEVLISCINGYKYQEKLTKKKDESKILDIQEYFYSFFKNMLERYNKE